MSAYLEGRPSAAGAAGDGRRQAKRQPVGKEWPVGLTWPATDTLWDAGTRPDMKFGYDPGI